MPTLRPYLPTLMLLLGVVSFAWAGIRSDREPDASPPSAAKPAKPAAAPADLPAAPQLRIETGAHTAAIMRAGTDAAGKYLVTASEDKTVRLWDAATGDLVRVLRPPIGPGEEGKLYAVAISPDGSTIACGGWTGQAQNGTYAIYIFEATTGRLQHRITGLPEQIFGLAYSRDGQYLAATLATNPQTIGVQVFRTRDWSLAGQGKGYNGASIFADFAPDGRLITYCYDGILRLYDTTFKLAVQRKGGYYIPRFSPDGSKIAVGKGEDMQVLSGRDLTPLFIARGASGIPAWSPDGRYLYGIHVEGSAAFVRRWARGGLGEVADFSLDSAPVTRLLLPVRDNGVAVMCIDREPSLLVLDETGQTRFRIESPLVAFQKLNALNVSADARQLGLNFIPGQSPEEPSPAFSFSLASRVLSSHTPPSLQPALENGTGWKVTNLKTRRPIINGVPLDLGGYGWGSSFALAPDGKTAIVGTTYALYGVGRDGKVRWQLPVPGVPYAVNIPNDRVAVVAYGDGTIRWHCVSDGKELLALFVHADHKRWVLWTPQGYYDCSVGGEDLIGWHLNHGSDHEADFFSASRLRDLFYRPDIVSRTLITLDALAAIKLAGNARGNYGELANAPTIEAVQSLLQKAVVQRVPPVVHITSPTDGVETQATTLTVRYTLRTPSGEPVTSVRALVDGQPVGDKQFLNVTAPDEITREIQVPIPAHPCEVALVAENLFASSEPARVRVGGMRSSRLASVDPLQQRLDTHTRLLAVVIGISKYAKPNAEFGNLRYADHDATSFADILKGQQGVFYQSVEVKLLTNEGAGRDSIMDALGWLKKTAQPGDMAVIFYAGHGDSDAGGHYYLLPYNYDAQLDSTSLTDADLLLKVEEIRARTLVFLDSCHSGGVANTGADNLINQLANPQKGDSGGVVVFAAGSGNQSAQEDARWGGGHGAFTYVLLDALGGEAADDKGDIWYKTLDKYLSDQVSSLTSRSQQAVSFQLGVPDFTLAHHNRPTSPGGKP